MQPAPLRRLWKKRQEAMASCLLFPLGSVPQQVPQRLNAAAHSHRGPPPLWHREPTEEPRFRRYCGRSGSCRTRRSRSFLLQPIHRPPFPLPHRQRLTAVNLSLCQLHAGGHRFDPSGNHRPPRRRMSEQPFPVRPSSVHRPASAPRCSVSVLEIPVEVIFCVTAVPRFAMPWTAFS